MSKENIGRWLFRYRNGAVYLFSLFLIVARRETEPSAIFLPLFCLGQGLRLWAVGVAGAHTRTRSDNVPRLATRGPYALTRNPIYFANVLIVLSIALGFGFRRQAWLAAVCFGLMYFFIVKYEEENLTRIFGAEYLRYRQEPVRWKDVDFPVFRALWQERMTFASYAGYAFIYLLRFR